MGTLPKWDMCKPTHSLPVRQCLQSQQPLPSQSYLHLALDLQCEFENGFGKANELTRGSRVTEPVLRNADAEEDTIHNNDEVFDSPNNVLAIAKVPTYSSRVASIIENTKSGEDAVRLLKSIGSNVSCHDET